MSQLAPQGVTPFGRYALFAAVELLVAGAAAPVPFADYDEAPEAKPTVRNATNPIEQNRNICLRMRTPFSLRAKPRSTASLKRYREGKARSSLCRGAPQRARPTDLHLLTDRHPCAVDTAWSNRRTETQDLHRAYAWTTTSASNAEASIDGDEILHVSGAADGVKKKKTIAPQRWIIVTKTRPDAGSQLPKGEHCIPQHVSPCERLVATSSNLQRYRLTTGPFLPRIFPNGVKHREQTRNDVVTARTARGWHSDWRAGRGISHHPLGGGALGHRPAPPCPGGAASGRTSGRGSGRLPVGVAECGARVSSGRRRDAERDAPSPSLRRRRFSRDRSRSRS